MLLYVGVMLAWFMHTYIRAISHTIYMRNNMQILITWELQLEDINNRDDAINEVKKAALAYFTDVGTTLGVVIDDETFEYDTETKELTACQFSD